MEPTDIDNKPRFYKRPTLIAKKSRESIAPAESPAESDAEPPASTDIYVKYNFAIDGRDENGKYDLTSNGSPIFNNYVELDGVDDYLSVGIDFEVKTLSFWFNLSNVNNDNYLLSFDSNFYIKVNSNSLDFQFQPYIQNNCNISKDFFNDIWYNLALTSNNTNYDIYLNNTKLPETIIYNDLSSSTLNIGAYINNGDIKYLNGKIADLRLYNTIKTEDKINTIYNEYNYVNIYTHIPEEDIEYDFSGIATFQDWINKADSHNIETFNFYRGMDYLYNVLSSDNNVLDNFVSIQCTTTIYKEYIGLLLELPTTHNYVEFTITPRGTQSPTNYTMFIDTLEKLDQDIFISNEDKNYKFEDNTEKFNEEYYYFAQFNATSSVTKKYNYKPGHYLKITTSYSYTNFDPNIKITLKKNYTEYPNLTFNENELFDILVVGGGGGGGYNAGGGGGAGGLVYGSNIILDHTNVHNIKVGKGGIGGIGDIGGIGEVSSTNGSDTTFGNIIAMGGGGGVDNYGVGNIGGSGGGSSAGDRAQENSVGGSKAQINKFTIGTEILVGYGNNGGVGRTEEFGGATRSAGGGGGAGSSGNTSGNYETDNGQSSRIDYGGDGGVGRQYDITGTNQYYAGGGGGGIHNNSQSGFPGNGGSGGGGNGGQPNESGKDGVDGTGSGGGGCGGYSGKGGNGGSGIVIIKKVSTDPPATGTLTLDIVNDLDSGYTLDSSISSNYTNITKIILNVNANIYRNDKPENYGKAGLIINLDSLTNLAELELNINPSKGIYGGPGSPGTSDNLEGGLGGNPIKIIGNRDISISYTEGAKLFKGGNGGNYTDWNDEVEIELMYAFGRTDTNIRPDPKPIIKIPNTDGLIGEFFNGNKKVKYNYNIIFEKTHTIGTSLDIVYGNIYKVNDADTERNIFNDENVYKIVFDSTSRTIYIHFVNKPAEGTDMTLFVMNTLSETPTDITQIVFNNNHSIIYDFSHITSLAEWDSYASDNGFNSTFDAGFQEASSIYYAGVWYHGTDTGFISKEIPTGYNKLRVEYQALWDNTVSIYITENAITTEIGDITKTARDTATVAEGLKIFETDINSTTDKYLTIAERYSTLKNNLKIVFY